MSQNYGGEHDGRKGGKVERRERKPAMVIARVSDQKRSKNLLGQGSSRVRNPQSTEIGN